LNRRRLEVAATSSQVDGNEEERRHDERDQSKGIILEEEGNSRRNSVERQSIMESLGNICTSCTYLQEDQG
jgi:hypothetical protein